MSRARTVKVTVYSCRNLKPKKGDGDPLAWVVFGFGKQKCCTGQIRDRNAKWNEESTFTITDAKLPLKLTVKDKDDTLGQIIVPVSDLPHDEHFLKWVPIGPHRKNPNPSGELCLDCWVDDFYDEFDGSKERTAFKPTKMAKLKSKLRGKNGDAVSPNMSDDRRHAYGFGVTSIKGSVSVEDISGTNRIAKSKLISPLSSNLLLGNSLQPPDMQRAVSTIGLGLADQRRVPSARDDFSVLGSLPVIREQAYPPKVLGVVPTSGPCTGGTLIQITGKNLGLAKEDISRLMVAGCNCLPSLEYYTSNKIMCTTTESEGIGPISITTKSGGTSSSKMMFEFVTAVRDEDDQRLLDDYGTDSGRCSGTSESDRDKDELIEDLQHQVQRMAAQNRDLREYIDKLVCYLMDKYPDALESSKMYR